VSPGQSGAGLGHTNLRIQFTNRSATACMLRGYPAVAGISATGAITPLPALHGSYFGDLGPSANIAPDQTAAVNVSGADVCPAAQGGEHRLYRMLRIGLPGGERVDVPAVQFDAICGVSVSQFGVPGDQPSAPPPSPLTAQITAAAMVRPGEDFTYTVTLANPTARAHSLRPCPAYEEYVIAITDASKAPARHGSVVRDCYLNCDTVHQISAHGSVTYQMRLQLPLAFPRESRRSSSGICRATPGRARPHPCG
jgi:hypothetical protein